MGHYKSNLRDIEFNLFEVFGRADVLGSGPYEELDADTAREMLKEVSRLAENELAESFQDADRNPPVYDPQTQAVTMPASFKASFDAYRESGFWNIDVPAELGGTVAPPSLRWAVNEMLLGANPALAMFAASYSFAKLMHLLGNEDQKKMARWIVEKGWHCTMVLTEPDAGSDVGAGRTRAVQNDDGTWTLTGVKRFITSAESDMVDNVVHFVLARPEGAGPGTKGLRLFVLSKYDVDLETGELGERNGVYVTNVEKKMGLKVSTTCELTFGGEKPAVGTLFGDVHDGIAQMFHVIENARMLVGTKAIATLSTGYLNALDVRQGARPGRRPHPDDRQGGAARHHHAPPRRAPLPHDPEGVRRGPARARPLHGDPAGHRRRRVPRQRLRGRSRPARPPSIATGSTTCCSRSSRAWAPSGPGCCSAPSRSRRSAARASSRTTRSSSTSATPRSTPSTRARPRSRASTSSSARSCATRARR